MPDNVGRPIDMNAQQLKGVAESLKGRVGDAKQYNKTADNNKKETSSVSPRMEKNLKDLMTIVKTFMGGKKTGKAAQNEKISVDANKALRIMAGKASKRGSIYTHDIYLEKAARVSNLELKAMRLEMKAGKNESDRQALTAALNEIIEVNKEMADILANPARQEEARKAAEEESDPRKILKKLTEDHLEKVKEGLIPIQLMRDLGNAAGELQKTIYGFRGTEVVFDGLLEKEREFTINARQIAYEISGATSESHGLQRSFEDIGKSAAQTGFDRTKTTNSYLANLKKGIRDQKSALSVSKTQLQTERMIGVEAGALGDTFSDMSLKMGMNTSQMSEFGRGVQEVARNTGVTGEALANAVKSSESIIKNMRSFGTLTAEAASNVVGVMASAEKFGAGDLANNLLGTLSQGMSGFMDANSEMKSLIAGSLGGNADLMEQMRNGTLLQTKDGMKGLSDGLDNLIARFSGGQAKTASEFEKLDAATKARINLSMKKGVGATATEIGQMTKSLAESMEPLSEKLKKIGEQKKKNLNAEEMAAKIEEERTLKTSTALGALTKLDEQLKISGDGTEGMKKALASVDLSGFSNDLKAMGIDSKDAGGAIKGALEASIKGVNEGLKKAGKSGLAIGANDIAKALKDPKELEKVRKQIDDGNAELAVAQKNAADPMTKLRTSMEQLNDTLRGATQSAISTMMDSVFGRSLGLVTTLVDVGGQFAGFVFDSVLEYVQLGANLAILSTQFGITAANAARTIPALWGQITASIASVPALIASAGGLGAVAAAAWAAAAPLLLVVGGFLQWAALIAGVWGMFSQAAKSGEKAGALFDKNMEDVTTAEYYAAKGAGFMTGALNTLTFGLFDSFIGAEGTITKALAQFNKIFPIMSAVMMVFDAIAGAIYGIGSSIIDIIIAPFEQAYYILEPIGEVFTTLGNAISSALGPLFGFSTTLSETGTIFTMFSNIFAGFGKIIRDISRAIGQTIGFLIRIVTSVLNPAIIILGNIIGGVANVIGRVFKGVFDWFMGAFKVLEGIFTLDFSKIGSGLWTMITSIPLALIGAFQIGFNLMYVQIPRLLLSIPKMIFDAVWNGVSSLAKNDWVGAIFQPFVEILKPLHSAVSDLYRVFEELFTVLGSIFEPFNDLFEEFSKLFGFTGEAAGWMGILKTAVQGISSVIGTLLTVVFLPLQAALFVLASAIKLVIPFVKFFTDLFTVGIVQAFTNLGKNIWKAVVGIFQPIGAFLWSLGESLLAPFKWLYNVLVGNSIVPDLVSEIIMFFATLPIEIMKGLLKLPFMIGGAILGGIESIFGLVPGAIGSALYSAASAVGMGWLFDKIAGTKGGKSGGGGAAKEAEATGGVAGAVEQTLDPSIKLLSEALTHGAESIYLNSVSSRLAMALPMGLIGGGITSGLTSLMGGSTTGSVASTAPSTTIGERVQRDLVTSEPEMASVGGPELGAIAESSDTQVEKLTQMVNLLQSILDNSQSGGGTSYTAELARMNEVEKKPPRYNPLSTGRYVQSASKQITNASQSGK